MVEQYRVGRGQAFGNRITAALARRGRGPAELHVLLVPGRRTGVERSTPVDVLEIDGSRYLVAPYGVVDWVRNVRAAGVVGLVRGGPRTTWEAVEQFGPDAVRPIREYIRTVRITRKYWEVGPDASDAEIEAIVPRHPVFRLTPGTPDRSG